VLQLVTPPAAADPLLTVDDVKLQLRITHGYEDALLTRFIRSSVEFVEMYTQRALVTQTWRLYQDAFKRRPFRLPKSPVQAVTSIKYYNMANVLTTLDPLTYEVDTVSEPARVRARYGQFWPPTMPRVNAVEIQFDAGYGAASAVPERFKEAMLVYIADAYANRESIVVGTISSQVARTVESILGDQEVFNAEDD
jgi:uncharacterized phiE125 gp8 family phage protein